MGHLCLHTRHMCTRVIKCTKKVRVPGRVVIMISEHSINPPNEPQPKPVLSCGQGCGQLVAALVNNAHNKPWSGLALLTWWPQQIHKCTTPWVRFCTREQFQNGRPNFLKACCAHKAKRSFGGRAAHFKLWFDQNWGHKDPETWASFQLGLCTALKISHLSVHFLYIVHFLYSDAIFFFGCCTIFVQRTFFVQGRNTNGLRPEPPLGNLLLLRYI